MSGQDLKHKAEVRFTSIPVYARKKRPLAPLRLSPNSTAVFRRCRQQYKFRYIDKLGAEFGRARPYFTMANHVHATLRDFFSDVPVELRTTQKITQLLEKNWQRYTVGFRDKEDERRWAEKALAEVTSFVSNHDITASPVMLEQWVEGQITSGLILRGRVDRVDREPDGGLHIIDYKTGRMPQDVDWTQVRLHALILSKQLQLPVMRISYLYLQPSVLESVPLSLDDIDQTRWELLGVARKIRREKNYLPNPGPWCTNCDFISICPRKVDAVSYQGPERQLGLWDDLEDDLEQKG